MAKTGNTVTNPEHLRDLAKSINRLEISDGPPDLWDDILILCAFLSGEHAAAVFGALITRARMELGDAGARAWVLKFLESLPMEPP